MTELWLPSSARDADVFDVEGLEIEVQPIRGDDYGRILGPDQAIFLPAHEFGYYEFDRGEVPAATVTFKPLREAVLNGVAQVELCGIVQGLAAGDGTIVPWPDGELTAYLRLTAYQVHVWIGKADDEWKRRVQRDGFALLLMPADQDGCFPYLDTGPLTAYGDPIVIAGSRRGDKVGRNEPCPCGSGLKHKRCCGG